MKNRHRLLVTLHAVVDPDRALVLGREAVLGAQTGPELPFEKVALLFRIDTPDGERDGSHVPFVAHVCQQNRGERPVYLRSVAVAQSFVGSDDRIAHFVDLYHPPDGTASVLEQDAAGQIVQYDHLAFLLHVGLVDKASFDDLDAVDRLRLRKHSVQRGRRELSSVRDMRVVVPYRGGDFVYPVRKFRFQDFHVPLVDLDVPPALESLVRNGGLPAVDEHRVDGPAGKIVLHRVAESVARAEQHDQHENAPCDRKAREESAQLVAADRREYLLKLLSHRPGTVTEPISPSLM